MKAFLLFLLAAIASCSDGQAPSQSLAASDPASASAAAPKVALQGRVTDAADMLSPSQKDSLSARLKAFERATGRQMVVVTVPSLGEQDIAEFTTELGNAWGIGRAGHDDGIILLVAPNERMARIAVGSGLEQRLPDALCQQIMDREIIPGFRRGDYAGGIDAGVSALIRHSS